MPQQTHRKSSNNPTHQSPNPPTYKVEKKRWKKICVTKSQSKTEADERQE